MKSDPRKQQEEQSCLIKNISEGLEKRQITEPKRNKKEERVV